MLILLMGFVLGLVLGQASADVADGSIPSGEFGDDTAGKYPIGWDWTFFAQRVLIKIFLGDDWAGEVTAIVVFIEPEAGDPADYVQRLASLKAFPTGRVLSFTFTTQQQLTENSNVGIHLMGAGPSSYGYVPGDEIRLLTSDGTINTDLLIPTPTPVPPPKPTPTPVPTIGVPLKDVTTVTTPTGGNAAIIQPSASALVSALDGSVVVAAPAMANATTFQLVYNPSPANVPAAPAGTSIIRAFELNIHDTVGAQVSLTLLKRVTITAKYTDADVAAAPQKSFANLKIMRYESAIQAWAPLYTTVDVVTKTLTAKTSRFSIFGVAGIEPAPQFVGTPTPEAPPTGDFALGSGLVLGLIIAGFLLISAGGTYLIQSRRLGNYTSA